jgi:hypothetical protein
MAVPARALRLTRDRPAPRPSRVHTVLLPDSVWDVYVETAFHEQRKDGVSEIIRELVEVEGRTLLRDAGVDIADDELITDSHAERYGKVLEARRAAKARKS